MQNVIKNLIGSCFVLYLQTATLSLKMKMELFPNLK